MGRESNRLRVFQGFYCLFFNFRARHAFAGREIWRQGFLRLLWIVACSTAWISLGFSFEKWAIQGRLLLARSHVGKGTVCTVGVLMGRARPMHTQAQYNLSGSSWAQAFQALAHPFNQSDRAQSSLAGPSQAYNFPPLSPSRAHL